MMTERQLLKAADEEIDRAERLLEIAHVARRLSKCNESVRRLIRAGKLPAFKFEGGWRVRQADLDTFVEKRRFTPINNTQHAAS